MGQWFPSWDKQFDDTPGGGFADNAANGVWSGVGGGYDFVAGAGDWLAGDIDESIGRQFDDTPGGGFADIGPVFDVPGFVPFGFPTPDNDNSSVVLILIVAIIAFLVGGRDK